ncbi:unnamed protein product [Effrenium voratum]|uniref:Uncharacterized protein n=1 Tax=Effrenium voratum TaxID=2562239 RepID=A0AA36I6X4_9DINO|nr:unnamed protein product [Effrenium voratum]
MVRRFFTLVAGAVVTWAACDENNCEDLTELVQANAFDVFAAVGIKNAQTPNAKATVTNLKLWTRESECKIFALWEYETGPPLSVALNVEGGARRALFSICLSFRHPVACAVVVGLSRHGFSRPPVALRPALLRYSFLAGRGVMQAKKSKSLLEKLRAKLPKPPSKEENRTAAAELGGGKGQNAAKAAKRLAAGLKQPLEVAVV